MTEIDVFYNKLLNHESSISVIGLGYVGYPLAKAFSRYVKVIGFDSSFQHLSELRGISDDNSNLILTCNPSDLRNAVFHIIAVPTPVGADMNPDLCDLKCATQTLAQNLIKNSVVVFESTVYPGVTEQLCIPIIERYSGMKCIADFKVAYSPERVNPGDSVHTLSTISKVVAGIDPETTELVKKVYELIIKTMIPVSSIKVAEGIKLIENCQRDINIAFMNEISILLTAMGINPQEVYDGMDSKWNALLFRPGLVGGHCIAVDPYYLIHAAQKYNVEVPLVTEARIINNKMAGYIGKQVLNWIQDNYKLKDDVKIGILGFSFKENSRDTRNTQVFALYKYLLDAGINVSVSDYVVDPDHVYKAFGIRLLSEEEMTGCVCVIVAVAHEKYRCQGFAGVKNLFKRNGTRMLYDLKGIYNKTEVEQSGYSYLSL